MRPVAFVDDDIRRQGTLINGIPVMGLDEASSRHSGAGVVVAVGSPTTRRALTERARRSGLIPASCVSPDARMSSWVEMGEGVVICAGSILTTNIDLRDGVQVNLDCTIGHDVVLGEYTTLAPGVHVSGWVHFGSDVYVGTGAVLINGTEDAPLVIGDAAIIGAGACVTKPVEPGVTVVGVPARPR